MNSNDQDNLPDCQNCDIRDSSILQCSTPDTLHAIGHGLSSQVFQKGDILIQAGNVASGFFFLRSGLVRNFKISKTGKEQTFSIRHKGQWVGFRDSLTGDSYFHSAVAMETVEACFIKREVINDLIRKDSKFQAEVFSEMAKEWREMEKQVLSLGTKHVHSKLAELILTLHRSSGFSLLIDLKLTRENLATIIGTKTETLVRALSDFRDRGFLHIEKNTIQILNLERLQEIAEIDDSEWIQERTPA